MFFLSLTMSFAQVWDSSAACFQHLKAAGYFIAATHLAPDSIPIADLDWTRPTAIIMCNESYGVALTTLEIVISLTYINGI
jgi:tRNA G18 (ribose-2'-O)-methylase SpoU